MKYQYLKPILIGVLCGAGLLLLNLLLIVGSVFISDMVYPDDKGTAENPAAIITPTPPHDDFGFLILLMFLNYILAPILITVAGACSVWLSPAERLSPAQLLLVSAIPGAVSMGVFTSTIVLLSLAGTVGSNNQSTFEFWLPAMAGYLLVGVMCSAIGGLIYGMFSGKLRKNAQAVDL